MLMFDVWNPPQSPQYTILNKVNNNIQDVNAEKTDKYNEQWRTLV